MPKRKQSVDEDLEDSSSDVSLIDVDFDFFDPNPTVDYLALKRLLGQLFQTDKDVFQIHDLAELILNQPAIGTTVKTDGIESDPYAFLTVLNMHVHHEHPSIKAIANYCLEKSTPDPAFHSALQALFSQNQHHVGFVFCERLINMPVQVMPPMYRMLVDELKGAIDTSFIWQNQSYNFSHFLFITRTYHLTPEEESALFNSANPRTSNNKKSKRSKQPMESSEPPPNGIFLFHAEDEYIKQASIHSIDYSFTNAANEPREKDAFGLDTRGRIMLLPAERFQDLVLKMSEVYSVENM